MGNALIILLLTPFTLIAIVPLLAFIFFIRRITTPGAREARRNELISKSPIFSDYASSIRGLITVRAYGYENWLIDVMKVYIDDNLR